MPSTYNPSGSNNNCFFVTLAYLIGLQSVDDLPLDVKEEMKKLPNGVIVDYEMEEIDRCLKLAVGDKYQYHIKAWLFNDIGSEIESATVIRRGSGLRRMLRMNPPNTNAMWRHEQFLLDTWQVSMLGVGYVTTDNKSHFVVLKEGHPPAYVCYQHDSNGQDKWPEIKRNWRGKRDWRKCWLKRKSLTEGNKVICAFGLVANQ
ncbi:hypothetical protein QBC37DRAFT_386341 [Rhypophila decipiens]|uniref:Uncharacterized protein n=1 Tax=Rhypophila decipiens TaxID=261697 RepID=A0AAN7B7B3_9PEZI|nr:hypothetical protein QBC37DRAFT_386341 [Rhypophila decipiens]